MSQPSLKEKIDDEQLLSTAFAIELEDVKNTLAQLKLDKSKPLHKGPFSLNVGYYLKNILKETNEIESRLEILESGEQPLDWNLYKIIWKLENISVIFNSAKLFEELKNKNDAAPNLARDFYSTAFLSKLYGYSFFIRALPFGCGPALGKSMFISISLIAGPFDDIFPWPFNGTIQISVFRQDKSGLIWTNLLKTNDKNTPCFVWPSPLQPNPSCGIFFYLPYEEMFKTQKNLIKNDNVYIEIKILDFPWTPVSIPAIVNPGWDVVFDIQQKEKEKGKLCKTKFNNIIFCVRHFDCCCASSNTSPNCLHPLQTNAAMTLCHPPYMDIDVTQQNDRLNSRDNNVIRRHLTACVYYLYKYWRLPNHVTRSRDWRHSRSQSCAIFILICSRQHKLQ